MPEGLPGKPHLAGPALLLFLLLLPLAGGAAPPPGTTAYQPDRELQRRGADVERAARALEQPAFEVPPMAERPLDIDEGEKIQVQAFRLEGVRDLPEYDINRTEVEKLVEELRRQRPEGFTVGRLQEVADAITRYYRSHGLILAQAYVPVQTVEEGVVTLSVLEGRLGRVQVEGNEYYDEALLKKPFEELVGRPVTKEGIERALLLLSDYPGLSQFGVLQPGIEVGTADILLKVQEEKRYDVTLRVDNHGQRTTGSRRYRIDAKWNNLTGGADYLRVLLQRTAVPSNSFFEMLEYERKLLPGLTFHGDYNLNRYDLGKELRDQGLSVEEEKARISLVRDFIRSRERNLSAELAFNRKTQMTLARGNMIFKDSLFVMDLNLQYDSVDSRFAGLNSAFLQYSHGFDDLFGSMGGGGSANSATVPPSRQGGNGEFATGLFDKVFFAFSRLQSMTPFSEKLKQHSLLLRTEFQWTPGMLVGMEQYAIGGPNNVRAYPPSAAVYDKGYFFSLEYIVNAPGFAEKPAFGNHTWGELLQFSTFFDQAGGYNNNRIAGTDIANQVYKGWGFGLSFNNPGVFNTRLNIAYPLGKPDPANGRHPQYWLDFNYSF